MKKTIFHNGIRHHLAIKEKARKLRHEGLSHREIAKELYISVGSAWLWTQGITISAEQKAAIFKRTAASVFTPARRAKLSVQAKLRLPRKRYSEQILLEKITAFYRENGRIPMKREFNMYAQYKKYCGGWNNAILAAGFDTNPELFAHKFYAKDGHRCDSFTEKIIDDWLYKSNISHIRHRRYGMTKMTSDFFVEPNIVIEFFGLAGVKKSYDEIIRKKKIFCAELGITLIEIYSRDIFPKNRLAELLGNFTTKS